MLFKQPFMRVFTIAILLTGLFFTMGYQVMAAESMTIGSQGQEVKDLQSALNSQDYWCGDANGIYGPRTFNALIRYQRDKNLVVNGKIDEVLKKALDMLPVLSPPADPQPAAFPTVKREDTPNVSRGGDRVISMVATGYTDAPEENWPYAGAPSYIGLPLARGIVAVDPNVIPMGTKLYIEGYGEGIAADQGGAIKGNRIDLFFDSKKEAFDWGMKSVNVTIIK